MDIKARLAVNKQKINEKIIEIISNEKKRAELISPEFKYLWDKVEQNALGGKKIRGSLVIETYSMLAAEEVYDQNVALMTATAIELMHAFLLVHDDFMDNDDKRRGLETIHKTYRDRYQDLFEDTDYDKQQAKHFSEALAVNTGDIICFLAFKLISSIPEISAEVKVEILKFLSEHLLETGYGQLLDIFAGERNIHKIVECDVLDIHHYKTGVYTYENTMTIGALLAEAPDKIYEHITAFAIPTGITFQLQDDIIGSYGDEDKIGKPVTSDMTEGKKTLLLVKALENGTEEQIEYLNKWWGNSKATFDNLEQIRKIFVESGSLEYSKELAKSKISNAKEVLNEHFSDYNGKGKEFLKALADYMLTRKL